MFNVIKTNKGLIKLWNSKVDFDENTVQQLTNLADMPFIHGHVAAMPDAHLGKGACVGSVIPQAYKNIDDVMESQSDLVEVVHTLKQVLCIKR